MAPYLSLNNTGYYLAGHTQLIAHGKAYRLYEEIFKSTQKGIQQKVINLVFYILNRINIFYSGKISISISGLFFLPKNAESLDDIDTAERANQFDVIELFSYTMDDMHTISIQPIIWKTIKTF